MRNKAVSLEVLIAAIMYGHKRGLTQTEVAKRLKMKVRSFYQRYFKLRKDIHSGKINLGNMKAKVLESLTLKNDNGGQKKKNASGIILSAFRSIIEAK